MYLCTNFSNYIAVTVMSLLVLQRFFSYLRCRRKSLDKHAFLSSCTTVSSIQFVCRWKMVQIWKLIFIAQEHMHRQHANTMLVKIARAMLKLVEDQHLAAGLGLMMSSQACSTVTSMTSTSECFCAESLWWSVFELSLGNFVCFLFLHNNIFVKRLRRSSG